MWRARFNFSRQDLRAILVIAMLVVGIMAWLWTEPLWQSARPYEAYATDSLLQVVNEKPQRRPKREYARSRPTRSTSVARTTRRATPSAAAAPDTVRRAHPYAEYMRAKLEPGERVDLNTADTTALMRVPGIGAVRARRIVAYRQSLGGYHSIAQVYEACDLPEGLGDWVHIGAPQTVKLNVNTMSINELSAHPYLSYHQARAIVELRRREGDIRSLRQLLFLDEFAEADAARLAPYLAF